MSHLLIHGYLHLLGYDHIEDTDAREMEAVEVRALATLDIADPYSLKS
ncbi:MAG: rRNA maturation RNase YbeY [Henriciella sp.]